MLWSEARSQEHIVIGLVSICHTKEIQFVLMYTIFIIEDTHTKNIYDRTDI